MTDDHPQRFSLVGEQVIKSVILMQCDGRGMHRVTSLKRAGGRGEGNQPPLVQGMSRELFHLSSILEDLRS